jgi:hypothetical protein
MSFQLGPETQQSKHQNEGYIARDRNRALSRRLQITEKIPPTITNATGKPSTEEVGTT